MKISKLMAAGMLAILASQAMASPTQQDVFKSINQNVSETGDLTRLLPWLGGAIALTVIVVLINNYQKRPVIIAKPLNHQKKLLREISRVISLRAAEMKVLRVLSEEQGCASPLTLLLCPSVLVKAARRPQSKVDKRTAGELALRLLDGRKG